MILCMVLLRMRMRKTIEYHSSSGGYNDYQDNNSDSLCQLSIQCGWELTRSYGNHFDLFWHSDKWYYWCCCCVIIAVRNYKNNENKKKNCVYNMSLLSWIPLIPRTMIMRMLIVQQNWLKDEEMEYIPFLQLLSEVRVKQTKVVKWSFVAS